MARTMTIDALIKEGENSGDSTLRDHKEFLEEMKRKYS